MVYHTIPPYNCSNLNLSSAECKKYLDSREPKDDHGRIRTSACRAQMISNHSPYCKFTFKMEREKDSIRERADSIVNPILTPLGHVID